MSGTEQEFLSRAQCQDIFDRAVALGTGGGETRISIRSVWSGRVEWARGRAYLASDVLTNRVTIFRFKRGATGQATTSRVDDSGLREALRSAEYAMNLDGGLQYDTRIESRLLPPEINEPILSPTLWSDATANFDGGRRGAIVRELIEPADAAGLFAAGELRVEAGSSSVFNTQGFVRYFPTTRVAFSTTVRDPKGTGSGWAGVDDFDIARIDMSALSRRAIEKCAASLEPVAIEPGRYTVILEPQAVADLFSMLCPFNKSDDYLLRGLALEFRGPFRGSRPRTTKIGERVLDRRLTMTADPMDPIGGFLPFRIEGGRMGMPYVPMKWIDQGVLRQLAVPFREEAMWTFGTTTAWPNSKSWRLSGGSTSVEEMIATTPRGLLVTRFHGLNVIDENSLTCTGYTRDGLWLIENGKITKPVKNFRFVESPLYIFNKLDQLGPPQRVFASEFPSDTDHAWVAPAAKVHDFNFTQLAGAV